MPQVCPYCRCEIEPDSAEAMHCEGCHTPHHRECYEENKGCTLFGCKFAPPDDPKIEVTAGETLHAPLGVTAEFNVPTGFGDVNAPLTFAAPARRQVTPPPPPPPPGTALEAGAKAGNAPPPLPTLTSLATPPMPKSRLNFILLGIFLGVFGAHNFYAGYTKRATAQLALTVLTVFYGSFVTWVWALVEVCTVRADVNHVDFA